MNAVSKTYIPKGVIKQNWRVIDATGRPLGRVASEVAQVLRGKDKPIYTPNMDTGDYVIVVNASKVIVTGTKTREKMYYTHSGYPGGFRATSFGKMLAEHPRRIVEWAVWGMLPKNSLGRSLFRKLKVYAEATHPHAAQVVDAAAPVKAGRPGRPRVVKKAVMAPTPAAPAPAVAATVPEIPAVPRPRARRSPRAKTESTTTTPVGEAPSTREGTKAT